MRCTRFEPGLGHRLTDNRKGHSATVAAERKRRDGADSFNPGKSGKFRKQSIEKLKLLLGLRVTLLGKALPKRQRPVGIEPWLDRAQLGETTNEKTGAHEQE